MTAPEKGRWYWFKNWLHYHELYLFRRRRNGLILSK